MLSHKHTAYITNTPYVLFPVRYLRFKNINFMHSFSFIKRYCISIHHQHATNLLAQSENKYRVILGAENVIHPQHCIHLLFLKFDATWWYVSSVMLEIHSRIFCFISLNMWRLFLWIFSFKNPHIHKSSSVGLEIKGTTSLKKQYGHQRIRTTLVRLNLLCVITPSCWNQQSCSSTSNMDMKFIMST